MKIMLILAIAIATVVLPGCLVSGRHSAVVAVIPASHVHSDECGHYSHGGTWYHDEGHRHCPGCGHAFVGGVWIQR